jgi:hypothetical protein
MRLIKLSNNPTVGRWVSLSHDESEVVLPVLSETQKEDLQGGGWAKVSYRFGLVYWPDQIVRSMK